MLRTTLGQVFLVREMVDRNEPSWSRPCFAKAHAGKSVRPQSSFFICCLQTLPLLPDPNTLELGICLWQPRLWSKETAGSSGETESPVSGVSLVSGKNFSDNLSPAAPDPSLSRTDLVSSVVSFGAWKAEGAF